MTELWREMARLFGDVKFCEIRADLCIEGYPERNTPTILIYRDGDIKKQVVTLRELRGESTDIRGTFRFSAPIASAFALNLIWKKLTNHPCSSPEAPGQCRCC